MRGKGVCLEKHSVYYAVQEASRRPLYIKGTLYCSTTTQVRVRYSVHELTRAEVCQETLGEQCIDVSMPFLGSPLPHHVPWKNTVYRNSSWPPEHLSAVKVLRIASLKAE